MKANRTASAMQMGVAAAILSLANPVLADTQAYKQLSGEWWQWILSIPTADNPLLDTTGDHCMVGQRGADWFLAGTFVPGAVTRSCSVPEGVPLFFPVINQVAFDTPNACGQDSNPLPSQFYRDQVAPFIDGADVLFATVDGKPIDQLQRVKSKVFSLALPEDNLFAELCAGVGGLPARVYSPAIDDGVYVRLNPLAVGPHTLKIHAENTGAGFVVDVTYNLDVVPVVAR